MTSMEKVTLAMIQHHCRFPV